MEKITIIKIGRKQQPSKFKEGETYNITTILDDKKRKMSAMGAWADNWKEGDVIEAEITTKKWTDKDGFEQESLTLTNPNKKTFTPGGQANPVIISYQLAASLAPLLYKDKKSVKLDDIDKLAEELKKRLSSQSSSAPKDDVKKIDVEEEEKKQPTKTEVENEDDFDDELPF